MMNTVVRSFEVDGGKGFDNYINFFKNSNNLQVIKQTLIMGIGTVVVCGTVGTFLAFYMNFIKVKFKRILHILLLSPMMVPGVIIVIAFIQLYGESGLITKGLEYILGLSTVPYEFSGLIGILFVHACTQYVYFYLNVSVALKYVDFSTIEAARGMGASKARIAFTIIMPAIAPALLSSTIVTFISGIGSFSAPNLIGRGYKVLSTQIVRSKANNYMNIASLQVVILLLLGLSVMLLIQHYEKKLSFEASVRNVRIQPSNIENPLLKWGLHCFMSVVVIIINLPIAGMFLLSFAKPGSMMMEIFPKAFVLENYMKIFNNPRVLQPLINSISMSAITVGILILISLPIAYFVAKRKNNLTRSMEILAMLPWAMPVSTIAINLINTFNVKNVFAFNKPLIGSFWILPLAYVIISLPLMIRSNILAMESFNISLEHASKSLGAGVFRTFRKVTAPAVMPAIISSGALVFVKTIGEYTMSALLYGIHNRPISIAMVTTMQEYQIELSMAYGVLTVMVCFAAMFVVMKLDKERYF
ncbi:MAG: iron ABC transporter permease [Clostridium sp.]